MALTKISTGMLKQDAASSDLNIDAGTLYIDVSNNRVGVANVAPAVPLHVSGDGTGLRLSGISPYTNGALLDFYHGGTRRGYIGSTGNGTAIDLKSDTGPLYLQASNNLQLFTGGTERMRIDSSGRVGIGTASPSYKFDIYGTDDVTMRIHRPSSGLEETDTCGIGFSHRGDTNTSTTDTRAGIFSTYNGSLFLATEPGGNLNSNPMDHSALMITGTSQNIGIGTTSPAAKLHVSATDAEIRLQHTGNSYFQRIFTDSSNNLKFGTGANGTERMRIDSSGNVGIGTNSPATKLEVAGTSPVIRLTDSRLLDNPSWDNVSLGSVQFYTSDTSSPGARVGAEIEAFADGDSASAPNFNLLFKTATNTGTATEKLRIDKDGRVGIGTTSPVQALDVVGSIQTDTAFRAYDSVGGAYRNVLRYDSGNVRLETGTGSTARELGIWTAGTERIRVDTSGNVGIGSTNPQAKLDIQGVTASSSPVMRFTGTGNASAGDVIGQIEFYNSDTTDNTAGVMGKIRAIAGASGGEGSIQILTDMPSEGADAATVAAHFNGNGNVGIGTDSPQERLHVRGKTLIQGGTGTTSTSELGFSNLFDTAFLRSKYTNPSLTTETYLAFHTNTSGESNGTVSEKMRLAGSNLGIGITNPTETLELTRLGKIGFGVNGDYGVRIGYFDDGNGVHGFHVDTKQGGTLTSESAFVVRANNNNVGIGTKNPAHALDIERTTGAVGIGLQARDDSSATYINFGDNSDDNIGQLRYVHSTDSLHFTTNNAERMQIDSSGNVLVGTTGHFNYSAGTTEITVGTTSSGSSAGGAVTFVSNDGATTLGYVGFQESEARIGTMGGTRHLALTTNNTERMRIDSNGKVIIGNSTSDANDLLQIETPASGGGHGIHIRRNDSNSDQNIGRILFGNASDNDLAMMSATTDGAVNNARLGFFTQAAGGSLTERLRIDASGRVIIQDDVTYTANAPTHRGSLILAGASGFSNYGGLEFHTSSGGGAGYGTRIVSSDATLLFGRRFNATTWSESMRIDNEGDVTIGASNNSGVRLEVTKGSVGSNANDSIEHAMIRGSRHKLIFKEIRTAAGSDWNNTTYRLQGRVDNTDMASIDFVSDSSYARHIDINTASNGFLARFDHNGRLGVKTSSPVSTLDVNGIISIKGNNVIDSDGTSHYFKTPGGAMYFYHGTTNPMIITATGVGMGAVPSFTTGSGLRIERDSNATLRLQDTGNHGYEIMASADDLTMRTMNNKPTRFKDASGNTTLTINNQTGALTVGGTVGTNNVFRTYNITGPSSSAAFTRTIDVNTYWGFSAQGGIFYLGLHGWQTDIAVGAIQFHNNGSGSQVITGVSYHEMVTSSGISISVAKGSGDREIDITFTNAHSNTHGWIAKVWA